MKVKEESEKVGLKFNIQKTKIMARHFMANRWGNSGNSDRLYFGRLQNQITADGDCSHEIKRCLLFGRKIMANLDNVFKKEDITLLKKVHSQSYGFSSSPVWMWELDHKESWALKNQLWCWRRLESPLDSKEIKPVNPKGNQPWLLIGRTDAEAEASILWAPDEKSWHIGKYPDAGTDWRQRRRDRQMMRWLDTISE